MKAVTLSMLAMCLMVLGCGGEDGDGDGGGGDAAQPKTLAQVEEQAKTMDLAELEKAFEQVDAAEDAKQEEVKEIEKKMVALADNPQSPQMQALQNEFTEKLIELQDLVARENIYRKALMAKRAESGNDEE